MQHQHRDPEELRRHLLERLRVLEALEATDATDGVADELASLRAHLGALDESDDEA